jgi:uncharacterized protein (DUF2141 family)
MKNLLILIFALVFLSFNLQNKEKTYSLTIKVNNLRNSKGLVQFALYNEEGSIPDKKYKKYYKKDVAAIQGNTSSITFSDLPEGKYAINILHDENKNGEIDKNFILPIEGIGFSNYSSIGFSNKPNFSKASFELNANMEIEVKVIYM